METTLKIRLREDQRDQIERAATKVTAARGAANTSGWIREVLLERAREVLEGENE